MIEIFIGLFVLAILILIVFGFAWYRIVPPSEAHLVVMHSKRIVVSPDEKVATEGKKTYFAIPKFVPFLGRNIRIMDVTIKELIDRQETYEKNQARYEVKSSLKYRIQDVKRAAETFTNDVELKEMLKEVVRASVRAVTVKYDVVEARANKQLMSKEISEQMVDDLQGWGLALINFQLVDFQDTETSSIVSDISKRREVEIQSETRERNAEKIKQARMKEAESEEKAREREIAKDRVIGEQLQIKNKLIAEKEKLAREQEFEVKKVEQVKQAEITKAEKIVQAEEKEKTEEIFKRQKKLEGEGDRARAEEQAKGAAAPIREKGIAEALAKEKLQAALNKFKPDAIRALVAEQIVEKDKVVGVAGAEALGKADLKVFAGDGEGKNGFEVGKFISSMKVANEEAAGATTNRLGIPNDLGFDKKSFVVGQETEKVKKKKASK